jgi:hypothetical protein
VMFEEVANEPAQIALGELAENARLGFARYR